MSSLSLSGLALLIMLAPPPPMACPLGVPLELTIMGSLQAIRSVDFATEENVFSLSRNITNGTMNTGRTVLVFLNALKQ